MDKCVEKILETCSTPEKGLPENVFLMISGLVPIPNVDLIVLNDKNEILLSWRDDSFFQKGWSIPGGCLRFGETMKHRVFKTAEREIGKKIHIKEGPLTVRDAIRGDNDNLQYPHMRGHNIAVPFLCVLDEPLDLTRQIKKRNEDGYLCWFRYVPENILPIHHIYDDLFEKYGLVR